MIPRKWLFLGGVFLAYAIPNAESLNQMVFISIPVDGKNIGLNIQLRWSDFKQLWFMSVFDGQETPLVTNIPLISSISLPSGNLLRQVSYKKIGSAFIVTLVDDPSTVNPSWNNLGVDKEFALVWGDTLDE